MPEPSGTSSRWNVHSDAYPASSALAANDVMLAGVAHAPDTGTPNPILMRPSLGPRAEGRGAAWTEERGAPATSEEGRRRLEGARRLAGGHGPRAEGRGAAWTDERGMYPCGPKGVSGGVTETGGVYRGEF